MLFDCLEQHVRVLSNFNLVESIIGDWRNIIVQTKNITPTTVINVCRGCNIYFTLSFFANNL